MSPPLLDRRRALRALAGGGIAVAMGDALAVEPAWLEVTEHDIPIPRLPRALEGFRIAQLTDIHLTTLGRVHDRVFAAIRARSPQMVVVTGDAVDDVARLPVLTELCHGLAAKDRVMLATLGNWEHWGAVPTAEIRAAYARAGARLLGDQSLRVDAGVTVIASDDSCSGNADPETALRSLRSLPPAEVTLFLSHAPGIFDALPPGMPPFHLGLAGHTHGGQLAALGAAVWVPPGSGRFRTGMYTTAHGPLYVSRGIGTSVVPARFTCRPELPIFRLVAA